MHPSSLRTVRRGLAALIVVVAAAVGINYFTTWRRRVQTIERAARLLGPELVRSAEGIEYSEHQNGTLRFTIRARRLVETRAGVNHLEGIEASDFDAGGAIRNRIRSERAEYDRDGRKAFFAGDVRIAMEGGVELRTGTLRYDLASSIGTTEDRLEMTAPEARGSARGVRYDHAAQRIEFASEVDFTLRRRVTGPPGEAREETLRATAGAGTYTRAPASLRFGQGARLESPSGRLTAAEIDASFDGETRRIRSLAARGGALYSSGEGAEERHLEGEEMRFGIAAASGALQSIDVTRGASFSAASGEGRDRLQGSAIHVDLDPASALPLGVSSDAAVEFRRTEAKQETLLAGDRFQASFQRGTSQLEAVTVRERARLRTLTRESGSGAAEELEAGEIRMRFRGVAARALPAALEAERSVHWKTPPRQAKAGRTEAGRELWAAALELRYASGGDALESGNAGGGVVLEAIPAAADSGRAGIRKLEARRVRFRFHPGDNRLEEFEAEEKVSAFHHAPAGRREGEGARDFRTSSDRLRAKLAAADGTLESVEQWGNVRYQDESRSARAGRSNYRADRELVVLEEAPEITDAQGSTTGDRIEYDRAHEILRVEHRVRTVLRTREGQGTLFSPSDEKSRQAPSIVTAERMEHKASTGEARYDGKVRLLAESGQLEAAELGVSEGGDRVEATGRIHHTLERAPEAPAAGAPAARPSAGELPARSAPRRGGRMEIRADRMVYLKSEGSVHYTGSTVLVSDDVRLESESVDVVLDPGGREVERAAARGHVEIRQLGRDARGDMADYYLRPGKFVVTGKMAEISDPQRGKSAARRLTFFTSDATILLENR